MNFDTELFIYLNQLFSPNFWSLFFGTATGLGNGIVQAVLIIPAMYYFSKIKFKRHIFALILTVATGGVVVSAIKVVVARQRPAQYFKNTDNKVNTPFGEPSDYSFPSGHTETAFSTATYLSLIYPTLSPLFFAGASLVALSRIVIGVHFPVDVIAGAILGILFGFLGYYLNIKIKLFK